MGSQGPGWLVQAEKKTQWPECVCLQEGPELCPLALAWASGLCPGHLGWEASGGCYVTPPAPPLQLGLHSGA